MKAEETRFLWLMIFFDLPVRTKLQRRQATQFRNFLRDDGFTPSMFVLGVGKIVLINIYAVFAQLCQEKAA
ncbi:CRISPR-associated endonuclease Cas2 [Bombella pollinis]|uniref:Uncharacterized protein n=1 Tax=Bombella pollinis TaxID=2967337 RepID=A0ABT3WN68_9PROT|nr:hypothetical protein [Bombella pollinis]MCX5620103.1 hypothetical protein [Bombella pollinis]